MHNYCGNTMRNWFRPWGITIERKNAPGTYDLDEAARLDDLVVEDEVSVIRIIVCFT